MKMRLMRYSAEIRRSEGYQFNSQEQDPVIVALAEVFSCKSKASVAGRDAPFS